MCSYVLVLVVSIIVLETSLLIIVLIIIIVLIKLLYSGNSVCTVFTYIINRELASLVSNVTYSHCFII